MGDRAAKDALFEALASVTKALSSGRRDEHDSIVLGVVEELAGRNELVMLAQASMGHLAAKVPASVKVPVLSSPTLAVQKVKEMVSG